MSNMLRQYTIITRSLAFPFREVRIQGQNSMPSLYHYASHYKIRPHPRSRIQLHSFRCSNRRPIWCSLGGPGFGKSTTTRYLAWRHAAANMVGASKKAMVLRGEPVPLRIELRPFAEAQKRRSHSFLSYTTEVLLEREGITSIKVQ